MASASQLRLNTGWDQPTVEAVQAVLHVTCWASPRHCPDTPTTTTLLSAAPKRPCSPFRLPPSLLMRQNTESTCSEADALSVLGIEYECSDASSADGDASSAASDASSAASGVVQERRADGGCSYCGLAITGKMTVFMGFDSRFCSEVHRCRGLSDRSQHWHGTDDFVDHVHTKNEHAPIRSYSLADLALPRTKCARVQ